MSLELQIDVETEGEVEDLYSFPKEDLVSMLQAARKENRALKKITTAVDPLDRDSDPEVVKKNEVLSKNTVTNKCSFRVNIHEELETFFAALVGNQNSHAANVIFQKIIKEERQTNSLAVFCYWGYMIDNTRSCDLLLRLNVVYSDAEKIRMEVMSVDESDLGTKDPLPIPHPTASKKIRLLLSNGTIILQKVPLGQTAFTFTSYEKKAENKNCTVREVWENVDGLRSLQYTKTGDVKQCRVTFVQKVDGGGIIPTWLVNKKIPEALTALAYVGDLRNKYDRGLEIDYSRRAKLAKLIEEEELGGVKALAQFEALYEDKQECKRPVKAKFGLADSKFDWFEPMMIVIGKGIVKSAAWGLMWRVTTGAVLSITDLVTDLIVLKRFWDGGEEFLGIERRV
ncbi:hypothetical protein TrVE_jg7316 [Triparma verrucosa]|uniref:Uncharacterized protein n=1 Tax=Triparma verrucosa TaxID=1606542 RepID=A0A9W7FMK5_9STRA|nr:hypothetical protein TrVE_jg7316 [Triparma verrucosa]